MSYIYVFAVEVTEVNKKYFKNFEIGHFVLKRLPEYVHPHLGNQVEEYKTIEEAEEKAEQYADKAIMIDKGFYLRAVSENKSFSKSEIDSIIFAMDSAR